MQFEVERYFKRRLKKKTPEMRRAVEETIKRLLSNPQYPSLRVKRVRSTADVWEASIDTANRITFHIEGDVIVLRNNCNLDILKDRP